MKRVLLGWVLMMSSLTGVKAQQVNFGLEAGVNRSSMAIQYAGQHQNTGMVTGFKGGIIADVHFNDMFSIQPGLYYSQKGYSPAVSQPNIHTNNIELPVNLQFRFPLGQGHIFTGGGPYVAYLLNADAKTGETQAIAAQPAQALNPLDAGININAGYLYRGSIFVRSNAGFGLTNLKPSGSTDNSIRNFCLSFTLGYMLCK